MARYPRGVPWELKLTVESIWMAADADSHQECYLPGRLMESLV